MYELIYNSMAVPLDLPEVELERILAGARKKNLELGITGVLLYRNGEFVQLLEGPREAVLHVYQDIIFRDRRHLGLTIGWEGEIAQRRFSDWAMGYRPLDELDPSTTPGLVDFLQNGAAGLDFSSELAIGPRLLLSIYEQFHTPR